MSETYDWSQFHVQMIYRAPLAEVFRRWSTSAGLESFFIRKATVRAADGAEREPWEQVQTGDTYHWTYLHDFSHGGSILSVVEH